MRLNEALSALIGDILDTPRKLDIIMIEVNNLKALSTEQALQISLLKDDLKREKKRRLKRK